jgi:hypothetical protein
MSSMDIVIMMACKDLTLNRCLISLSNCDCHRGKEEGAWLTLKPWNEEVVRKAILYVKN